MRAKKFSVPSGELVDLPGVQPVPRCMRIVFLILLMSNCAASYFARDAQVSRAIEIRQAGLPVIVTVKTDRPNSASGVDLHVQFRNISDKTIKYFDFTAQPFNAVGDAQTCSIRRNTIFNGRDTGPFAPNAESMTGYFDSAWYNSTIVCAKLKTIEITFMDGSTARIPDASKVLAPETAQCPPQTKARKCVFCVD
jgi:hypothetical protein